MDTITIGDRAVAGRSFSAMRLRGPEVWARRKIERRSPACLVAAILCA